MTDLEIGTKVLRYFWKWNGLLNPNSFKLTFEQFLQSYGKKINIHLDGIGVGVRESGISDSRIESAMRSLASNSKGKIPSDYQIYFKYLSSEAVKINWIDAAVYVAKETAKDVGGGVVAVGNSLLTTGKILNFLLPAILIFIVFAYVNRATQGDLVKAVKGLRK